MDEHRHHRSHDDDHGHGGRAFERICDVAVVGGSAAGLAAGLQLGRQRRDVIVIDAGEPRNAPAGHMHGYLGLEGVAPTELTAAGREEVRSYGGDVLSGRVIDVTRPDDGRFRLVLTGGTTVLARRVLAATGLVDELPDIDGLVDHWGRDVIHCPFCHGYEVRDRRVVEIVTHPMGLHAAPLFRQLTDRLTVVVAPGVAAEAALDELRDGGVEVITASVAAVRSEHGRVSAVELSDGRRLAADAVAVGPGFSVRIEPFASLRPEMDEHPSGLGAVVRVDAAGQTTVPGLYAAGNLVDPSHQVIGAAADGARVGAMISFDLAREDLVAVPRAGGRRSSARDDWEHRYAGDQVWSGNPNGTLVAEVAEVAELAPGRALDVGAGEGGDAIWLAEQGWEVTANDISSNALDRIAAEADRRSLAVERLCADANDVDPFGVAAGGRRFDLVTAQYASLRRSPDDRAVRNLLDAVAPGGTLVVVGHDLGPMRAPIDVAQTSRAFDPDSQVRVADVAAVLADDPDWVVDVHEIRPRPPGAASAGHHVDDEVLRAHRR